MDYSPVRDIKSVTVTKTNPPHREKITLGYATLIPDDTFPADLGARWDVRWMGRYFGQLRRITWTPSGSRTPRTGWNATRPDGTPSRREPFPTRNDALRFLIEA